MKKALLSPFVSALLLVACLSVAACVSSTSPGTVTSSQQTVANAVEDTISIGLVPVLTKNPSYIGAALTVSATLGSFSGTTLVAADVDAFLAKVPQLSPQDARTIAGIVNAAWGTYTLRYQQQLGSNVRPDVKLFLASVSNGISRAVAATPK